MAVIDHRPIGVFDSGVGGLTVAKEILELLPEEELIYFGDSGRAPYGNLTKETLITYSIEICDFLISKDVKALVVACNTTCATCLELLREKYDVPIIGVIEPGAEAALQAAKRSVGIMGTLTTINSKAHEQWIRKHNEALTCYNQSCPLLVPIVEEGMAGTTEAYGVVEGYVKELLEKGVDTLILGCTHYPILIDAIKKAAGEGISIVDPSRGTAVVLKETLTGLDRLRPESLPVHHQFYVSGDKEKFDRIAQMVLGKTYESVIHTLGQEQC